MYPSGMSDCFLMSPVRKPLELELVFIVPRRMSYPCLDGRLASTKRGISVYVLENIQMDKLFRMKLTR